MSFQNISNSIFNKFLNDTNSNVKSAEFDGQRYFEVDVAGFKKEDLKLEYSEEKHLFTIEGKAKRHLGENVQDRTLNIDIVLDKKPKNLAEENGLLTFTVPVEHEDDTTKPGFTPLDFD